MKIIFKICFIINILFFIYVVGSVILMFSGNRPVADFFWSNMGNHVLMILVVPSIILFLKSCTVCLSKDNVKQGVCLFFLNVFYNPFYFVRMKKKGWI